MYPAVGASPCGCVMTPAGGNPDWFSKSAVASTSSNVNPFARLVIPLFRNLFFGPQKAFLTGFLRVFFLPANSGGIFHRNMVLEGVAVIPVFSDFTGIFRRNSWGTGIPVFTPDSSGIRSILVS